VTAPPLSSSAGYRCRFVAYPGGISTSDDFLNPTGPNTPGTELVPAGGGPLPVSVRLAADEAARSIADAWREAGWVDRLKGIPAAATEALEQLLDRIVKSAIEQPIPVFSAADVRHRLETEGHAPPVGGALFLALAARSKRSLKVGKRAVPLAVAAKIGADVASSFRLGAFELELLASLVVNRLRKAGMPVDPRLVQRITVNAYLSPRRRHDVARRRRSAAAQLAAMWSGRVLSVEPAIGRLAKAAELVDAIDFVLDLD
jgi:hypothetical protein